MPEFNTIYLQKSARENSTSWSRAKAILSRYPESEIIEVESHWNIPELRNANPQEWIRSKKGILILGIKSGLQHTKNGRSADFIAASAS
ncbi:MAG: spore photoproduct lyase family protein, partial [Bdellovibrionia bacterium]